MTDVALVEACASLEDAWNQQNEQVQEGQWSAALSGKIEATVAVILKTAATDMSGLVAKATAYGLLGNEAIAVSLAMDVLNIGD